MTVWFSLAALLIAAAALFYTWRLHKEVDRAAARLDRYNKALFDAGEEIRRLRTLLGDSQPDGQLDGQPAGQPAAAGNVNRRPNITLDL